MFACAALFLEAADLDLEPAVPFERADGADADFAVGLLLALLGFQPGPRAVGLLVPADDQLHGRAQRLRVQLPPQ